jgi:hypothetical protein
VVVACSCWLTSSIYSFASIVLHAKCVFSVANVGPGVVLCGAGVWTLLESSVSVELEDLEVGDSGLWRSAVGGTCLVCAELAGATGWVSDWLVGAVALTCGA